MLLPQKVISTKSRSRISFSASSRASTAKSTKSTNGSRASTAKSGASSAKSQRSAAAIVAALSRPSSQKSGAWSKDDPEAGQRRASTAKTSKTKKTTFEEILEEELAADEYKGQEHVGCWTRITNTLSRKSIQK